MSLRISFELVKDTRNVQKEAKLMVFKRNSCLPFHSGVIYCKNFIIIAVNLKKVPFKKLFIVNVILFQLHF